VEQAESDPAGYEAGQRQRAIERNIRKYKRRETTAVVPEAQRAARLKVRQWQAAMRDHITAHPDLRRLRHREQPGASNLPEPRTEATPEQTEERAGPSRRPDRRLPRKAASRHARHRLRARLARRLRGTRRPGLQRGLREKGAHNRTVSAPGVRTLPALGRKPDTGHDFRPRGSTSPITVDI
jgi:hypothetical protein